MIVKSRQALKRALEQVRQMPTVLFIDYTNRSIKTKIKLHQVYDEAEILHNPDSLDGFVKGVVVMDSTHSLPEFSFSGCVHILDDLSLSSGQLLDYDGLLLSSSLFSEKCEAEIQLEESVFALLEELEKLLPEDNEVRLYREQIRSQLAD